MQGLQNLSKSGFSQGFHNSVYSGPYTHHNSSIMWLTEGGREGGRGGKEGGMKEERGGREDSIPTPPLTPPPPPPPSTYRVYGQEYITLKQRNVQLPAYSASSLVLSWKHCIGSRKGGLPRDQK